ncbi:MAG: hypothetical protein P1U85_20365 [Verrucomicrobiales bacterium]|nr:hypothetical protein [Verrucomicrobiales bacterium]
MKLLATLLLSVLASTLFAQTTIKREISVGLAKIEDVRPILEGVLSPAGKFLMLSRKGSVLVIDTPEGVLAAEQALAGADFVQPDIALDFEFVTGLPSRTTSITVAQEVPFPTEYAPPTILVGPNGPFAVIPATPTKFQKRNIGVTSETTSTLNPDGSITMDINVENTEFEGFVNYGSGIFPVGAVGTIPVQGQVGNPGFFSPLIQPGAIQMPILSTTRISTSIVIRPRLAGGSVQVDLIPRLTIAPEPEALSEREPEQVDFRDYRTTIEVAPGSVGRVRGFSGASEEFNRHFLGAKNLEEGSTAIKVRAQLKRPNEKGEETSDELPEEPTLGSGAVTPGGTSSALPPQP